ncbi:MAG: ABC transporter permease [Cellulosilyticum sp.]|nr:ABC transporter permease [Cellulosilyticum sp.]
MRQFWVGLKLDLKQLRQGYIKLLLFIVSSIILSISIGVAGSQILYDDVSVEPFGLAIVDHEDSQWTHMIIGMVEQMDTVTRLCKIQRVEEVEAKDKLKKGEVMAIITIPGNFVRDVMTGVNTPLTIEKKEGTFLENVVVDKLITSATKLLSAAQIGVYSTLDCYNMYGDGDSKSYEQLLQEINLVFIKRMLARNKLFLEKEIVATGSLEPFVYYVLSGFVIMMILSLMLTIHIIEPMNNRELLMRYKVAKVKAHQIILQKWLALTLFYIVLGGIILTVLALASKWVGMNMTWRLSVNGIVGVLITFATLAAIGVLIALILKRSEAYGLFLFVLALVQAFLSGGLLPSAFMPEYINKLGYFTYNKYAISLLGNLTGVRCHLNAYLGAGLILISSLVISCLILIKRGVTR